MTGRSVCIRWPIRLRPRVVREIHLREPGRRVVDQMRAVRLPSGLTNEQVVRFASRLSTYSEAVLRKLDAEDMDRVRAALEGLYVDASRRLAARDASKTKRND